MNKTDFELSGLAIPVPTPFTEDSVIDFGAFLAHLDWLAECGVRNLLVNGTTGEFFSLTPSEQLRVLQVARENWDGIIIAHTGSPALFQTLETAHAAEEIGADFLAALPPFYFAGAPADGLVRWFNELAESTELPLILYNFPKHTGNPLTPEILKQVPHYGMKDSSADLSLVPATPRYFVGGDRKISAAYAAGAKGFVSAASNANPEPYVRIEKFHPSGASEAPQTRGSDQRERQTLENQAAVDRVYERFSGPFAIARIKQALSEILPGYPPYVRPPLTREPV